jgi:hypothetical protein
MRQKIRAIALSLTLHHVMLCTGYLSLRFQLCVNYVYTRLMGAITQLAQRIIIQMFQMKLY